MTSIKLIILIFIVLITFSLLFLLILDRVSILKKLLSSTKEGMNKNDTDYSVVTGDINSVLINESETPAKIGKVSPVLHTLPLKQFVIKGSQNSAYSGNYISDEMVKYVLSRGCRYLDFEIYYLPNASDNYDAYVGYSSDSLAINPQIQNTYNARLLDILKAALSNGLVKQSGEQYECPNVEDPLFIQLRMKTDSSNKEALYRKVQEVIMNTFHSGYEKYFITDGTRIDGNTPYSVLKGKAIVVVNDDEYKYLLFNNIVCNTKALQTTSYDKLESAEKRPPKIIDTAKTNVNDFTVVNAAKNKSSQSNPNILSSISNYGNQINLMQYYVRDTNLLIGENMFSTYGFGMVPIAYCIGYAEDYGDKPPIKHGISFIN